MVFSVVLAAHPSRLAEDGSHLRMTIEPVGWAKALFAPCPPFAH
jgi:hypothetical protein